MTKDEILIEVQLQNGQTEKGRLFAMFKPEDQGISLLTHDGENRTIPLDHIVFILFHKYMQKMSPSNPDNHMIDEVVRTRNDERFQVHVNSHQDFSMGFFGMLNEARNGYHYIFFPWHGVRNREELRHLGEILRDEGMISESELEQTLNEQTQIRSQRVGDLLTTLHGISRQEIEKIEVERQKDIASPKQPIGEILVSARLITRAQLDAVLTEQRNSQSQLLGDLLVSKGLITDEQVVMAMALKSRLRYLDLLSVVPEEEAMRALPVDVAEKFGVFPIRINGHTLVVATSEPADVNLSDMLRFRTDHDIELVVAPASQIKNMIHKHYYASKGTTDRSGFEVQSPVLVDEATTQNSDVELQEEAEKAPVVKLANQILLDAVRACASDIHVLPVENGIKVSFRIHGQVCPHLKLDRRIHKSLMTRFKMISGMDITEQRLPQDGRILMKTSDRNIELRVSCMPGQYGENMVFRMLSRDSTPRDLSALGFDDKDRESLCRISRAAQGLLLVTGATGSGKATTLRAILNTLTDQPKHLISLEDPIEAKIEGVNQIQINTKIGFTYASALRNVLRHDPDVIMLGETQDSETAQLAVQAALTGHTVFSTMQTGRAIAAFSRLVSMGVERYLVATTIKGVLAQHLIPKLCSHCRTEEVVDEATHATLRAHDLIWNEEKAYVSSGCDQCHGTGVAGRLLVYELLHVNEDIQHLIITNAHYKEFVQAAKRQGVVKMGERALDMARRGETALEYVLPLLLE